jgi:hypothetical protein
MEKERLKGAWFDYSEISIFYVFPKLLTGRTVLVVTILIPGNAKPMKYSVKWRFLDARRQRCHRRPCVAGRSFVPSFVETREWRPLLSSRVISGRRSVVLGSPGAEGG